MMYAKQLYLGIVIVTALAATHANARENNPLHPSYYWGAAHGEQSVVSGAKVYANNRNPLHPSYAHVAVNWQPVVAILGESYRNTNNPLHPSYKR